MNPAEQFRPEAEFPEAFGRLVRRRNRPRRIRSGVFLVGDAVIRWDWRLSGVFAAQPALPAAAGFFLRRLFFPLIIGWRLVVCLFQFFRFYARSVLLMQRFSIILFSPRASAPAARIHGVRCRRVGFFLPGFAVGGSSRSRRSGSAPLGMGLRMARKRIPEPWREMGSRGASSFLFLELRMLAKCLIILTMSVYREDVRVCQARNPRTRNCKGVGS